MPLSGLQQNLHQSSTTNIHAAYEGYQNQPHSLIVSNEYYKTSLVDLRKQHETMHQKGCKSPVIKDALNQKIRSPVAIPHT